MDESNSIILTQLAMSASDSVFIDTLHFAGYRRPRPPKAIFDLSPNPPPESHLTFTPLNPVFTSNDIIQPLNTCSQPTPITQ